MKRAREASEEVASSDSCSRSAHSLAKPFVCSHDGCDKRYNKRAKLADHQRTHTGERPFSCDAVGCNKSFYRKAHLQAHARSHLPKEERPFECPREDCQKRFTTNQHLRQHAELHLRPSLYRCGHCEQSFHKHHQLKRHVGEVHLQTKSWPCLISGCGMSFHYESILIKHAKRVHNPDKRYACGTDGCDEVFGKWSLLQKHVNHEHKLVCSICKKQFTDHQAWKLHCETHELPLEERRKFACHVHGCSKRFTKAHARKRHIEVAHENARHFACDQCSNQFAHKKTLEAHVERQHSGMIIAQPKKRQKKVISIVSQLTGLHYELGRHLPCPHAACQYRFSRNYDLDRHLSSYHATVPATQAPDITT
ncbi:RNA polymerase III transcription factor TFIIIA [Protomyces lactucae-debilis]|uniref:RNA polymerase III transcription factor TFIIIA n=1 Tax=Protomyces lactucae-debilis TaxID=2754530 RepID=A0A1Y2FG80_PROLT|nr:RNA polymerase III transcription factor TFIIIA [Protomyces lactucae-debilis]ORY82424.1 RNA polymerase III transcription factor TFIIIA [Protomyces lactucae-debilis]